ENLTKRGSVKAETSLSAVELSGKVQKRGYLLKQVSTDGIAAHTHTQTHTHTHTHTQTHKHTHMCMCQTMPSPDDYAGKGSYNQAESDTCYTIIHNRMCFRETERVSTHRSDA